MAVYAARNTKFKKGQPAYRNWVHLQASRPSVSIFDSNPGLYFYLSSKEVFSGGGLYEPSSRQIKQIRSWLSQDPKELTDIFKSKAFKSVCPAGFETEKILKTLPRHYPPNHKRIEWLRLQAFYVTQSFTKKELYSADFKDLVLENWRQVLRLNETLYDVLKADPWTSPGPGSRAPQEEPETMDDTEDSGAELWDERL